MDQSEKAIFNIEKALNNGQVFQAHNLATESSLNFPDNLRIIQLKIITLNRLGQSQKALETILDLVLAGHNDVETLGLLGRTYKDLYKKTNDDKYLHKSADAYLKGHSINKDYYPAINAASLHLMLGDVSMAHRLAQEVLGQLGDPEDYWSMATKAEAELLLGRVQEAQIWFDKAVTSYPKQFGKYRSTLNQLIMLSGVMDIPQELLDIFPKPRIALFTGHMIDAPDRSTPRFPIEIEPLVSEALKKLIDSLEIDIGFTSLASGGDILFMEIMKDRQGEIKAYMPFRKEDFINSSVEFAGHGWINRFENCYDCGPKLLTSEPYLDTPELFTHLGRVMMGECLILAKEYGINPYLITILADNQKKIEGGTQDLIDFWPFQDHHHNIDPTEFLNQKPELPKKEGQTKSNDKERKPFDRNVTHILFADIVGFTRLLNDDTPIIILELFKRIKQEILPFQEGIEVINTWGDAIIICHEDVEALTQIAWKIRRLFDSEQAQEIGLPKGLNIRIAMHAGPVFFAEDPLTNEANVYGSSINRTARMEPVTLPGSIYASDQFAALLKLKTMDRYDFRHVGIIELPKGFGRQEVYEIS